MTLNEETHTTREHDQQEFSTIAQAVTPNDNIHTAREHERQEFLKVTQAVAPNEKTRCTIRQPTEDVNSSTRSEAD